MPHPGWDEQDPLDWCHTLTDALLELAAEVPLSEVTVIGITCQREGFAMLDEK